MKWKWFVGDEFNYKLVSTECFYTPNPDDVNQNLQVEWTRKLNGDCVMQNYHLGKIRLSCCVENLLMSFEMMGKAIFTRIRNYRGEVCTMFLEREYISINRELETHSKCIFHFDMKDIRIDCLACNRSSFGFCINLKYEFFVETRLELILIYCTIRLFALSAEDCRKNSLSSEDSVGKEKTTEDEIQKRIHRSTNNYFLKRFPLSQRPVEEKCHSSNSTSKPLQISRPIPESVWHAKEDMPRQTL